MFFLLFSESLKMIWVFTHYLIYDNEKTGSLEKVSSEEGDIYDKISHDELFHVVRLCSLYN